MSADHRLLPLPGRRVRRDAAVIVALTLACVAASPWQTPAAPQAVPRTPLTNSDVSILVPLKATAAVDDVLKATGTGLCNALQRT